MLFRSAVESGTDPNPAAYYPVKNVRIENNTFDYCTAAAEMNYGMTTPDMTVAYPRKYPPQGVFQKNLIFADDGKQAVNEIGTSCQINYLDNQQVGGEQNSVDGFLYQQIALLRNDTGFLYTDSAAVGADLSKFFRVHKILRQSRHGRYGTESKKGRAAMHAP